MASAGYRARPVSGKRRRLLRRDSGSVFGWAGPVLALQWAVGWRTLRRHLRAVLAPTLLATGFFTLGDQVAIRQGIWRFDPAQIPGWRLGALPVEEALFFFLTSLLVSQSLLLLLPKGEGR